MSVTCQTIVTRAASFSALNAPLVSDRAEMLSRIRADQQEVFTSIAGLTRDRFQTTTTLASTTGASGRSVDLSTLTLPVERVLKITLPSGEEVSQVDILDQDADLAPRYMVQGTRLIEVENDWDTATTGSVTLTITYVTGMTDIDPSGAYTQAVSVPDQWIDLLVLPLAMYLVQKDPGRDPAEYTRLETMLAGRQQAFVSYLTTYGGTAVRRFDIPSPRSPQKG